MLFTNTVLFTHMVLFTRIVLFKYIALFMSTPLSMYMVLFQYTITICIYGCTIRSKVPATLNNFLPWIPLPNYSTEIRYDFLSNISSLLLYLFLSFFLLWKNQSNEAIVKLPVGAQYYSNMNKSSGLHSCSSGKEIGINLLDLFMISRIHNKSAEFIMNNV